MLHPWMVERLVEMDRKERLREVEQYRLARLAEAARDTSGRPRLIERARMWIDSAAQAIRPGVVNDADCVACP